VSYPLSGLPACPSLPEILNGWGMGTLTYCTTNKISAGLMASCGFFPSGGIMMWRKHFSLVQIFFFFSLFDLDTPEIASQQKEKKLQGEEDE
jgi:hypothetical protein